MSEILSGESIPVGKLAYFRSRLTNKIHELVLTEFARLERNNAISKAELARRIGKKPEQVTRWLGAPGNWTLETFSDLLLGMKCEPVMVVERLEKTLAVTSTESDTGIYSLVAAPEPPSPKGAESAITAMSSPRIAHGLGGIEDP